MTTVGICSGKNTHPGHFPPLACLKEYNGRMVSNDNRCWVTPLEGCVCVLFSIQHDQSSSVSPAKGWDNMLTNEGGYEVPQRQARWKHPVSKWSHKTWWDVPTTGPPRNEAEDCLAFFPPKLAFGNWPFTPFPLPKDKFACSVFLAEESSRWLDADDILF